VVYGVHFGTIKRVNIGPRLEDVDLGVAGLPTEVERTCSLDGQLAGFVALEKWSEPFQPGLTRVSTDASFIVTAVVPTAGGPSRLLSGELPKFPAGAFYVAPGLFMAGTAQAALIERAVAGEDLAKTAIPRVTLAADQENQVTIDLAAAEKAILDGWKGEE